MLKEKTFDTGVVKINYAEGPPSGPPLLFLHGAAARWQTFMPIIPHLSVRWQIYALDFRGYGKSGRVPGQYQLKDHVADTIGFLEHELKEPAVLFGHSMGGWVAIMTTAQSPIAVKALVIEDSGLYLEGFLERFSPLRDLAIRWRDAIRSSQSVLEIASKLADGPISPSIRFHAKTLSQIDPDWTAQIIKMYEDSEEFQYFFDDYLPHTLLPAISCPVLLLQANPALGGLMTDSDVERALSVLADVTHVQFKNAGHGIHSMQTEDVVREVTLFLESL